MKPWNFRNLHGGGVRFSLSDILTTTAAIPVAVLASRALIVLAPMFAQATLETSWSALNSAVERTVEIDSVLGILCRSLISCAPAICFLMFAGLLLGSTQMRFGWQIGIMLPLATLGWSYYIGPRGEPLWHVPFLAAVLPTWLMTNAGWRIGDRFVSEKARTFFFFYRGIICVAITFLAASSNYWWMLYWAV